MAQAAGPGQAQDPHAGIPYRVPPAHLLPERTRRRAGRALPAVQRGLRGQRRAPTWYVRPDAPRRSGWPGCSSQLHARRARGGRPARADAAARRPARRAGSTPTGDLVTARGPGPRRRWDRAEIAEGRRPAGRRRCAAAARARTRCRRPSPPATRPRPTAADTDWPQIAALYGAAGTASAVRVVELNRAVAVGMADGPAAGLRLVDDLAGRARSPATTCCPRPAPTCSAGSAARAEAAAAYQEALGLAATERRTPVPAEEVAAGVCRRLSRSSVGYDGYQSGRGGGAGRSRRRAGRVSGRRLGQGDAVRGLAGPRTRCPHHHALSAVHATFLRGVWSEARGNFDRFADRQARRDGRELLGRRAARSVCGRTSTIRGSRRVAATRVRCRMT